MTGKPKAELVHGRINITERAGILIMREGNARDNHRYDDIIHLPHHVSTVHPPMPVEERAAQFSPFAALTGFEDTIRESGRLTSGRIELDEDAQILLNEKLEKLALRMHGGEAPEAAVTYFLPDGKKEGGAYITATGKVKKVDMYEKTLIFADGKRIPMREIVEIDEIEETDRRKTARYEDNRAK